jgi:hypothetical protein
VYLGDDDLTKYPLPD